MCTLSPPASLPHLFHAPASRTSWLNRVARHCLLSPPRCPCRQAMTRAEPGSTPRHRVLTSLRQHGERSARRGMKEMVRAGIKRTAETSRFTRLLAPYDPAQQHSTTTQPPPHSRVAVPGQRVVEANVLALPRHLAPDLGAALLAGDVLALRLQRRERRAAGGRGSGQREAVGQWARGQGKRMQEASQQQGRTTNAPHTNPSGPTTHTTPLIPPAPLRSPPGT